MKTRKPKRVLLEIGPGTSPITQRYHGKTKILLDSDLGVLEMLAFKHRKLPAGRKPLLVKADAKRLPLRASSVGRIEYRLMHSGPGDAENVAREAQRVLANNGTVTISVGGNQREKIEKAFEKQGFKLVKAFAPSEEQRTAWETLSNLLGAEPLVIKFKKVKK